MAQKPRRDTEKTSERGFTLIELLVVSLVGLVALIALSTTNFGRLGMLRDLRARSRTANEESQPALAMLQLVRTLEMADRINLIAPTDIQIRRFAPRADNPPACPAGSCTTAGVVPAACCFELSQNYHWAEYKLVGHELRLYDGACGNQRLVTDGVDTLAFAFTDTADAPTGGDPDPVVFAASPADTNALAYQMVWTNAAGTRTFTHRGLVATRAAAYTDVMAGTAGLGDSGLGLDTARVSDPPAGCT